MNATTPKGAKHPSIILIIAVAIAVVSIGAFAIIRGSDLSGAKAGPNDATAHPVPGLAFEPALHTVEALGLTDVLPCNGPGCREEDAVEFLVCLNLLPPGYPSCTEAEVAAFAASLRDNAASPDPGAGVASRIVDELGLGDILLCDGPGCREEDAAEFLTCLDLLPPCYPDCDEDALASFLAQARSAINGTGAVPKDDLGVDF